MNAEESGKPAMRLKGRIREWRDDKGFGFIEPLLPGPAVFVHIKSFTRPGRRPQVGDLLIYTAGRDPNGRPRAERVEFSLASRESLPDRPRAIRRPWAIPLAVISLVGVAGAAAFGKVPLVVPGLYAGMSLITYVLYTWDKVAARGGRWRTQESTLLLAGLLGGWPGALIAQETLRHKTAKASFRISFWFTVVINVAVIAWAASSGLIVLDGAPGFFR